MDDVSSRSPQMLSVFPSYRRSEQIADSWVHAIGIALGLAAVIALLVAAAEKQSLRLVLGVGLYSLGLLAMLCCSALYNLAKPSPLKGYLRRFDRAAIFVMIAGSYTPFFLNRIGGGWGWGMLDFVWTVATFGVGLAFTAPRRFERTQLVAYLLLGWSIVAASGPLFAQVDPRAILLLIVGGLFYSLGVPVHLWRRLSYNNAIWHALVLVAAGCHYAAIVIGVVEPSS
jgi:hemolysin III